MEDNITNVNGAKLSPEAIETIIVLQDDNNGNITDFIKDIETVQRVLFEKHFEDELGIDTKEYKNLNKNLYILQDNLKSFETQISRP